MRRVAVTLAIVLATSSAHAQTTGYKVARKPRMGLVYAGAGMLGVGVVLGLVGAIASKFEGMSPWLAVPIAGPWVAFGWDIANPKSCPMNVSTVDCSSLAVDPGLVALGAVETIGAALLGIGVVPHEVKTKVTVSFTGSRFIVNVPF